MYTVKRLVLNAGIFHFVNLYFNSPHGDHDVLLQWWPIAKKHKKKAQAFPENGIKGRINIVEVKAYSSMNHMNVSDHVYIVHCSRYIGSKQVTPKAA
jgi:hypothetical protein